MGIASIRVSVLASIFLTHLLFTVQAQVIPLVNGPYIETFVGNPKVSGNLLVGLSWNPPGNNFDAREVGVLLFPRFRGRRACVEVASQDGRYFAQNLYEFPNGQGERLFQANTNYDTPLRHYPAFEMAVSIRLVDDCNSPERGVLIPAIFRSAAQTGGSDGDERLLVAYLNADSQHIKVLLRKKDGGESIAGTCRPGPNAVKISFSSSCEFPMPPPSDYVLAVRLQERFDSHEYDFNVSVNH
jgi:hypothetical protein